MEHNTANKKKTNFDRGEYFPAKPSSTGFYCINNKLFLRKYLIALHAFLV